MTKEEQWFKESIENYIFAYTGKRAKISDADAQHFTASVMSYLNLCTPSLPSNLDEAADAYSENILANGEDMFDAIADGFRAGAKWMAGQGVSFDTEMTWFDSFGFQIGWPEYTSIFDCFNEGDKVVVQIRKK